MSQPLAHTPELPPALPEDSGAAGSTLRWFWVAALVYLLVCAVNLIGSGFKAAAGDQAARLFEFAANPLVGLMIGVAATALVQSSSTVSSIIVGLVAGGLPGVIAIPMIMGANIGTTVTNTLVSLAMAGDRQAFRRAFSASTVHDVFNVLAVAIFLPLELMFGMLERSAATAAALLTGAGDYSMGAFNFVRAATAPTVELLQAVGRPFPGVFSGIAVIVLGIVLIFLSISLLGRLLGELMTGRARHMLHAAIGRGPIAGIGTGTAVTVLVQSSSTTTSLIVPLAGSGALSLRQVYPFTLGANIGTCVTALLAATAVTGALAIESLEIALVHLFFNVFAVLLIFGLPALRELPLRAAETLGRIASRNRLVAAAWVLGLFFALPLGLVFATRIG